MTNLETSFPEKAEFLKRNVCGFTVSGSDIGDGRQGEGSVLNGLEQYRNLLLSVYTDAPLFAGKSDLESYHNLTYAASFFLYAIMKSGRLIVEGANHFLLAKKQDFKKHYRKGSAFPFQALENHGLYFVYRNKGQAAASYRQCDEFEVHFECGCDIALALKYLSEREKPVAARRDYVFSSTELLALADFDGLLRGPSSREAVSPLGERILRTAGTKGRIWQDIVSRLQDTYGLCSSCSLFFYTPAWIIRFHGKSENVCIFTLLCDRLVVEVNLSYDDAAKLSEKNGSLPEGAQRLLGGLKCIRCGRCDDAGKEIKVVNGIQICMLENYARRLVFEICGEGDGECLMALVTNKLGG